MRLAFDKLLANLAADDPVVPLALEQRAKAVLAGAVGRRGVQQVDAQIMCEREQVAHSVVVWQVETVRILYALITADLDGTQPEGRQAQAGVSQGAVEGVQGTHWKQASQSGAATRGRGRSGGSGGCPVDVTCWRVSSCITRSLRLGARASLVGQLISALWQA